MLRLCNASVVVRRAPPERVPRSHEPLTLLKDIIQEFLAPMCHTGGFSSALERTSVDKYSLDTHPLLLCAGYPENCICSKQDEVLKNRS